MEGEPVDRRGLFREMFRQARDTIVPALAIDVASLGHGGEAGASLSVQTASLQQLSEAASDVGLERRTEALGRLARRSLRVVPSAHAGSSAVGFGGRPLMAEGHQWPSWQGRPLTFLAQVETGEPLGRLMFFYDVVGRPSGCLAAHRGSAAVMQANDRLLSPVDGPALPADAVQGAIAEELVLPRVWSAAVEALDLSGPERAAWEALREELAGLQGTELADRPDGVFRLVHRIFGYPDDRGDEMELTCELASAGEDVIEGRARLHPQADKLQARSSRWELLAQFSGDGKLSWPWVAQRVFFWVDRDALARGELSEVWAIAR